MSKSGPSIATGSKLVCPGNLGSFYEGLDPGLSICSNCFEKRKAHKLPSVTHQKKLWLVTEGEAVSNQFFDPIPAADMLRPVQRTSPPNLGTTASIQRPLPHWKTWFECLDSAGQPVGMYVNGRVSQPEKPELPLPLGWIAELDSMFRTFYVNVASGTSHWEIPLPLYWKERRNPDGVLFFCREFPDLPEVPQSVRPHTFAFCPYGHPLRSYCDRPPADASRHWLCNGCKSRINFVSDPARGVLHCSACPSSFTICHFCCQDLLPELLHNSDGCPMLPGIGRESGRFFCHRIQSLHICGTDGWQCPQCAEVGSSSIQLRNEERRLLQLQAEQQRARALEEERKRLEAKEAINRDLEAKEAARLRQEQQRLEDEKKRAIQERQRQEAARQEEERQQRAARAIAKEAAEKAHALLLIENAKAETAARLVREKLKEWAENFCVGRWVQVTAKGPNCNRFALVLASPSDDGALKIQLFQENVRRVLLHAGTLRCDIQAVSSECCICGTEPLLVAASMSCIHKPLMCKGCLSRYLDEKFQSAGLQDMKCPFSDVNGCRAILHEQEIRHCIGEQRSNWEKRLSSKIQTSFDMIPCAFPNCGASYFREDIGDSVSFTCRECRQSTCVACQTLVHPGRTCTENMTMKDEDLGLGVQRCPSCRSRAVKEGDECDRLLCLQCHAAFCAKCSAPYDGPFGLRQTDNSAHEPTCSNYFEPEEGKPPVYTLRRASQHKSNAKSESPPPSMQTVLWTVIAEDVKKISKDQESDAFATLEAEFAKGRGERTANIVLDGKVKLVQMKRNPNSDEFWLEGPSGIKIADLVRELAHEDAVLTMLPPRTDLFDPSLLFRDLNPFSDLIPLGTPPKHASKGVQQAAAFGGSFGRMGAAAPESSPLVEIIDPTWIEGALDDGKKFWYKNDDPKNPTFVKPVVPRTLQAARAMYSSVTNRQTGT